VIGRVTETRGEDNWQDYGSGERRQKKDRVEMFKKWITSVLTEALNLLLNKLHWLRWSRCSL